MPQPDHLHVLDFPAGCILGKKKEEKEDVELKGDRRAHENM